jgi:hypothetical protein
MSVLDDVLEAFTDLDEFAAPAVLTRVTPGAYSTTTGAPAAGTTTTCSTSAVLDVSSTSDLVFKFGPDLVKTGDALALVPAKELTFEPSSGDTLTVLGVVFRVISNQPIYTGAVVVMHQLLVRR